MNDATGHFPESRLILGTAQWGMRYGIANSTTRPTLDQIRAMLTIARDNGIRTLDTARAYGESEAIFGEVGGNESYWEIITKLDPSADSAVSANNSIEESLHALRRKRINVLLLHRPEQRFIAGGSVWDEIRRARDTQRVASRGVSALCPQDAWAALEDESVECIQVATSLFDQRLSRHGFFEAALMQGKTVFVRSVFLQGVCFLEPGELPAHLMALREALSTIREWSKVYRTSCSVACLAFVAHLPHVRVVLGSELPSQVSENASCWKEALALGDRIDSLACSMPDLPDSVIDPSQWPS